jgi:hypothetical protein
VVARQRPSSESVTMVVLCGPRDTSYSIPYGTGVNHFFSPVGPNAVRTLESCPLLDIGLVHQASLSITLHRQARIDRCECLHLPVTSIILAVFRIIPYLPGQL